MYWMPLRGGTAAPIELCSLCWLLAYYYIFLIVLSCMHVTTVWCVLEIAKNQFSRTSPVKAAEIVTRSESRSSSSRMEDHLSLNKIHMFWTDAKIVENVTFGKRRDIYIYIYIYRYIFKYVCVCLQTSKSIAFGEGSKFF